MVISQTVLAWTNWRGTDLQIYNIDRDNVSMYGVEKRETEKASQNV